MYIRDYNAISWRDYFEVKEGYLVRKSTGRVCNSKTYRENGTAKCIYVSLIGTSWMAHRIIYIIEHGNIPDGLLVDHVDGNPFNNSISNLRLATESSNMQNQRIPSNNVTGNIGVQRIICTKTGTLYFRASWMENGKQKYKSFNTNKFGKNALQLAIDYRKNKIEELNKQGNSYTERHGVCDKI